MKVQILGLNCDKCETMRTNVAEAVKSSGIACEIEHIGEILKFIKMGVVQVPGLVINGKVVSTGKALSVKELIPLLQKAQENEAKSAGKGTGK